MLLICMIFGDDDGEYVGYDDGGDDDDDVV